MGIGFCPRCGERRLGSFRNCRKCGFDYEIAAHPGDVAPGPAASEGASAKPPAALAEAETPVSAGGGPTADLRIKRRDLLLLVGTGLVACLTLVTAYIGTPQSVRLVLGVMIVFVLPGFAGVCAVLPPWRLTLGEHLVASLGISLALATAAAVLLGATPIGLSRQSFSLALGLCTWALSVIAVFRWRPGREGHRDDQTPSEEVDS
jgi:Protein of unknown function (DUF1616)